MLKLLLSLIADGRVRNTQELAVALGTSPAMVEALVAELQQRGLLERIGECETACAGCPVEERCGVEAKGSAWMLTTAGRRYARR